jgi:phosphate transport system protein
MSASITLPESNRREPIGRELRLNTHLHLEETLQRDIETLHGKVAEMARLTDRALQASVQALVQGDRRLAYSVILRDQYIDELETELDRLCLEFLVRQLPAGSHLRLVFAVINVNRELERIGDYAESIARQVLTVSALTPQPSYARFVELGDLVVHMLRNAIQALLRQDADLAWRTMASEEVANTLRNTIISDLAEASRLGQLSPAALGPLTTVARRLERAADQVKNLCENVLYLCTGQFARHKGANGFHILFYDVNNACLSQMAEAIGNSLGLPRIHFSSAGAAPQPLDARAVEFLAAKGTDISRQAAKTLEQVPRWDQSQVIIALGPEAGSALPRLPAKTIVLTWPIPDPARVTGPSETWKPAFESAARSLESNIRELAAAILEEPQAELKL